MARSSPEGAPPPAGWRRLSWGLLAVVFLAVAAVAGWAGWSLAGRTGLIVGLSLAALLALLRAAPTLIAAIFRRSERRKAEQAD